MPTAGKAKRFSGTLFFTLLVTSGCFSQPVSTSTPAAARPVLPGTAGQRNQRIAATEICGNNMDDDGNGLIDDKDFTCYYSPGNISCKPSSVIWASMPDGLYWADPQTGASGHIGNFLNAVDITWASNGKLYSINYLGVNEIDPYTAQVISSTQLTGGFGTGNAMTGDGQGNLFLVAILSKGSPSSDGEYIIKYSIATRQITPVAYLKPLNVSSAGDLTFLNGYLYLSCGSNQLARFNPATGNLQVLTLNTSRTFSGWGLVTLGDGYLYITNQKDLYQIDPVTLQVVATPYYTFPSGNELPYGLSTYVENCNAPSCSNPTISVSTGSLPPYCAHPGITLQATGSGVIGESAISWTLPDGTITTGNSLQATQPGIYTARYHNVPDDCGHDTSFTLSLIPSPRAALNRDSLLCQGSTIKLAPLDPTGITSWLWQDGATTPGYLVSSPGRYTLQVSNLCGTDKDSIMVYPVTVPLVYIGADTGICPGVRLQLFNEQARQPWDVYTWSTAALADTITVSAGNIYWLETKNVCGIRRDSMRLTIKDSCTCFPYYARAGLPGDREMCSFDSLLLKNAYHDDGFRYHWQNGSGEPKLMAYGPGIYWVDVSTWCGTVRDSIIVYPKKYGCEQRVTVPNAFSPGGNSNTLFRPVITGPPLSEFEFMVYNRWGQLVFYTKDRGAGWDGKIKNNQQPAGIYAWSCTYRFNGQPVTLQKGTMLLVR